MHDSSHVSWRLLLASFVFLLLFSHGSQQLALADHTAEPTAVAVAGSLQDELGCPGDWQPECLRSWLQDPDGDGTYSFTTTAITPGSYEAKVTINEAWDENYGVGGEPNGPNIPFTVTNAGDEVLFSYNPTSHILTIETGVEPPALEYAVIHYNRPGGDYDGWGLHLWTGFDGSVTWGEPFPPAGEDSFGVYFEVPLVADAPLLNYIIHKGDEKDPGPDQALIFADTGYEIWQIQGN
ncbi:MAG: hypothetical protein KDE56_19585, partial [Anaerolineales bacterium]|nr:hypothetical protein [Anaerolineales bacterium]